MSADPSDPSSTTDPERRRVPLERKISLKFKEFRGFITEYSANLSMGGMFIRTTSPKPIGTIFDFELSLTDDFKLVQGIAEVVWIREGDDGPERPMGMGVRFLDLSSESRKLIERIVQEQVAHGGTPFELESPGFPPPPLRGAPPGAVTSKPPPPSPVFHPTAAPVAPAPPPPGRTAAPPSRAAATPGTGPPRPAASPARAAAPPQTPPAAAAPAPPPRLTPPPAPPRSAVAPPPRPSPPESESFPELDAERTELLPELDESWDGAEVQGIALEEGSATDLRASRFEPVEKTSLLGSLEDDPTVSHSPRQLLRPAAMAPLASPSSTPPAPRPRVVPAGFDEVARAFSDTARPGELPGETVRLGTLPPPDVPAPRLTPPIGRRSPPVKPAPAVAPRSPPVPPSLRPPPSRRPPARRRSRLLPVAAGLVLLLAVAVGVIYLRFPRLLPAWAPGGPIAQPAEPPPSFTYDVGGKPKPAGGAAAPAPAPGGASAAAPTSGGAPPATGAAPRPAAPGLPSATAPVTPAGSPLLPRLASGARFSSVEEIWGQRTTAGTVVTIVANGVVPADAFSHFRLEGDSPREVVRLRGVDDSYRRPTVALSTAEVKGVRVGYHTEGKELHVVIDLTSPRVKLLRLDAVDNRLELLLAPQ
ncbi:MAG TPA: TIGR02266 family protein [Thermoanaerobaculia bacterium]|jgi:WAS/WASL-interacting protein|nr:TIGR02266 family protein [Thermoanaerobaculia bacterium]